MQFPVYRKYKNNRSYFKIINETRFEEIQMLGSKRILRTTEAKLYPEMNFINDLVHNFSHHAEEISADEYDRLREGLE